MAKNNRKKSAQPAVVQSNDTAAAPPLAPPLATTSGAAFTPEMLAQVEALLEKQKEEVLSRLSRMMDKKLQKFSAEFVRANGPINCVCSTSNNPQTNGDHQVTGDAQGPDDTNSDDNDPLPDISAISLAPDPFPIKCCPLPRSVPVYDYLCNYRSKSQAEIDAAGAQVTNIFARHKGGVTADVVCRLITTGASPRHLMTKLWQLFDRSTDEDLDQRVSPFFNQFVDLENDSESSVIMKERSAHDNVCKIAAEVGLVEVPLSPRDAAGLDAEFDIRRRLLIDHYNDPYHIFDYLDHLRLALLDSPLPPLIKCRRLNNLLPPPWIEWYAQYDAENMRTIFRCFNDPPSVDIPESVAQDTVDHVVEFLTLFLTYKDNPQIGDEFFRPKSWAPLRNSREGANLIWQHKAENPPISPLRKVTIEDLAKEGCLTVEQMDFLYAATSGDGYIGITPRGHYELLQVCHPFLNYIRERVHNETDLSRLAKGSMQDIADEMGLDGVKMAIEIGLQAASQTPYVPDHGSFSRLSDIFRLIDLEYVEDEMSEYVSLAQVNQE